MAKYKAFISFRKTHSTNADLVKQALVGEYGFKRGEIFLDKHNIGPGQFDKKLERAVKSSSCLVLIVTKGCFVPKQDDWYLKEIKTAITNDITIIPLLFDDIKSLSSDSDTLESLKSLEGDYFTAEEISVLQKSQSIRYDYDLSEATFSQLTTFVKEEDLKSGNSTTTAKKRNVKSSNATTTQKTTTAKKTNVKPGNATNMQKVKRGAMAILCILLFFALAFMFFVGVGYCWGYLTSSTSQEKIMQDNSRIEGSTAIFSFRGAEARYYVETDSIYVDRTFNYRENFPETNYTQFVKSCTATGAMVLFNKNIKYVKYFKFLKGGSKQSKLAMIGISVAIGAGSICGFSQGSELGRKHKQEKHVEKLYRKLEERQWWTPVLRGQFFLMPFHMKNMISNAQNTITYVSPDSAVTIAKEGGLSKTSILLKYNEWEIGQHPFKKLKQVVQQAEQAEKEIVFMEIDSLGSTIKAIRLPKGRVGINIFPPKDYSDIQYAAQEYYKWKADNQNKAQF